jgi:hypothetical protein
MTTVTGCFCGGGGGGGGNYKGTLQTYGGAGAEGLAVLFWGCDLAYPPIGS